MPFAELNAYPGGEERVRCIFEKGIRPLSVFLALTKRMAGPSEGSISQHDTENY